MRLLLIEDSEKLRYHLTDGLRKAGFEVDQAGDGRTGLWQAKSTAYDAIILDLMLPGLDGSSILSELREEGNDTGILILTAMDGIADRVKGLRSGADDYLTKPFAFDELVARVQALIRRRYGTRDARILVRGLSIDTASRTVLRDGRVIELTPREYAVLEFLALRRDRVHTRSEIEAQVCDSNAEVSSNVIDAAVYSLRRKIDKDGEPSIIRTRRGMGYLIPSGEAACLSDDE